MKKHLIIIVILLAYISARSQDLIILYNGEKIEAKVMEVSETEIRYKRWNNLSGPTWVKNVSEIERIKYQKDRFLMQPTFKQGEFWDFATCSSTSQPSFDYYHCVSGNEIVNQIDIFYANSAFDKIRSYIDQLPSCVNRDCIHQYYLEHYYQACDEENTYDIIRYGETYLKTGGETEFSTTLSMVAKMYAIQGNEIEVEKLMKEFEQYSKANDDFFDDDIEQLRQETYELLHPYKFEDEIKGKWVVLEATRDAFDRDNPLILEVDDVTRSNGIRLIPNAYKGKFIKHSDKWQINLRDQLNVSQGVIFDASNQLLITRFASEQIKDRSGNEDFARMGIDEMRNTRADMIGTIASSNASFEDKLLYSGVTILATSLIEELFKSSTISSKSVQAYTFALIPRTKITSDVAFSYVSGKNVNGVIVKNEKNMNQRRLLVKWEENDSVYFVSSGNTNPITLAPIDKKDPLLWEYNQIQKRERRSKTIAGLSYGVSASVLTGLGVNGMVKYFKNNKENKQQFIESIIELGAACMLVVPYSIILGNIDNNAKHEYSKLNIKNRNKLIRKAERAEKKLSVAPCYDSETNAIGASVNLTF